MKKTFSIVTLGCKVNQYESACLQARFEEDGWVAASPGEPVDVTIVNTCIVTQAASHQSRQEIRKAIRENEKGTVAAIGCYGQAFPEDLKSIKGLRLIAGNVEKGRIPHFLSSLPDEDGPVNFSTPFPHGMRFEAMNTRTFPGRSRAFLKIQDGCESFCSYCIVPFARGPYRTLPPGDVLRALERFSVEGYGEVVMTGIHLGKYGIDVAGHEDLKSLLRVVAKEKLPLRIRLSSLEPGEIDEDLIDMVASETWLCRHFHIPLQSGDDGILKKMGRTYSSRTFAALVKKIHDRIPFAAIGADVMTGFPGEDHTAHSNSVALLEDLPVSYLHVFPYSRRPGTPAAELPAHVPPGEKKKRAAGLRSLGASKRLRFFESCTGRVLEVVTEGWHAKERGLLRGISDNYVPVIFSSSAGAQDDLPSVRIERVEKAHAIGHVVRSALREEESARIRGIDKALMP
jgi:threonylcarbamoyladenosine tRNA methylthiotransferase MtaB